MEIMISTRLVADITLFPCGGISIFAVRFIQRKLNMEKYNDEKIIYVSDQIIEVFLKNRTAGYIAFRSLDHLDLQTRATIMYRVSCFNERLPEDLRNKLFEETGNIFERHRKRIEKNLPVKKLIEMFKDKRSGMVAAAASQLKERFLHLDHKDQVKVMDLFLDCSVSYRKWCYRTLMVWCEPRYDATLVKHWHRYKDHDCLAAIIHTQPSDTVRKLYPEFRLSMNRREEWILLERFGMEPWVEIDKEWIKASSSHVYYYIRSMSRTHLSLSADECAAVLYDCLHEAFSPDSLDKLWELNRRFEDENHNTPPLCYQFDEIRLPLTNNRTICVSAFLKLFAKMGHYNLITGICSWGESVNRLLPFPTPIDECEILGEEDLNMCKDRFQNYIRLLRENMPRNFEGISDTSDCNIDAIANEFEFKRLQSNPVVSTLIDKLDLAPF